MTQMCADILNVNKTLFSLENLYPAYLLCRRRKRNTRNALLFESQLEEKLLLLYHSLNDGSYQPGRSQVFLVQKPKKREIFAADFADRVVHHLLISYLEKQWEPHFIHDSYACRKNKGTLKGVQRLQKFTRQVTKNGYQKAWYLQLDIQGFFMAIHRHVLYERLMKKEQNPNILWLIRQFVYYDPIKNCHFRDACLNDFLTLPSHKTLFKAKPDCGLPIGNLTSQFFANVYLDALDQFVKHQLKCRFYVRYCDDFILLSQDQNELIQWQQQMAEFLEQTLHLQLNHKRKLQPVSNGIDFLGYVIRPHYRLVRRRVVGNLTERLNRAEKSLIQQGLIYKETSHFQYPWHWETLQSLHQWLNSYYAHFKQAASDRLWQRFIHRFPWLREYFIWKTQGNKTSCQFRYPLPPHYGRFEQQKNYFVRQLTGHLILIQTGTYCQLASDTLELLPHWKNLRLHQSSHGLKQLIEQSDCPIAWVKQTGRSINIIAERTLVFRTEKGLAAPTINKK